MLWVLKGPQDVANLENTSKQCRVLNYILNFFSTTSRQSIFPLEHVIVIESLSLLILFKTIMMLTKVCSE